MRSRLSRNVALRFRDREIQSQDHPAKTERQFDEQKFSNFELEAQADPVVHGRTVTSVLPSLHNRSAVVEIVGSSDVIFVLTQVGLCFGYSRPDLTPICCLNVIPDELIRSLFFNKENQSLITVSMTQRDNFSALKCRTTPLSCILSKKPNLGTELFETESLEWPGFVEFDDVNKKIVTFSAPEHDYKVWDLKDYSLLYTVKDQQISEIKLTPGLMLLIGTKKGDHVPLRVISISTGDNVIFFEQKLEPEAKLEFVELFNEKLLIKQYGRPLRIIDIHTKEVVETHNFRVPTAFVFLYENNLFLTFLKQQVGVWDFNGEMITKFKDHIHWYNECNTNLVYINEAQDLIISYCHHPTDETETLGSINISNILTGESVGKISQFDDDPSSTEEAARLRGKVVSKFIQDGIRRRAHEAFANKYKQNSKTAFKYIDTKLGQPPSSSFCFSPSSSSLSSSSFPSSSSSSPSLRSEQPRRKRRKLTHSHTPRVLHSATDSTRIYSAPRGTFNYRLKLDDPEPDVAFPNEIQIRLGIQQAQLRKRSALTEVTAMFYNKRWNEIYTGNAEGILTLWTN